ncbi:hypothetical protein BDR26DRAFT_853577 [Obelidium mucronatum]|nr:hypothetical protein BDR26DRAFT_853577 [Obelidium mucronatum]
MNFTNSYLCKDRANITACLSDIPEVFLGMQSFCQWDCTSNHCSSPIVCRFDCLSSIRPNPSFNLETLLPVIIGGGIGVVLILLHAATIGANLRGAATDRARRRLRNNFLLVLLFWTAGVGVLVCASVMALLKPLDQCTPTFGIVAIEPFYVGMALLGLGFFANWILVFKKPTYKFLKHLTVGNHNDVPQLMQGLRSASTTLTMCARCYHTDTIVRTNDQGKEIGYTVQIDTDQAAEDFLYSEYYDMSDKAPENLDRYLLVFANFEKLYHFTDEQTKDMFDRQYANLRANHKSDRFQEYTVALSIHGYRERLSIWNSSSPPPYYLNRWFYVLVCLFFCAPFYEAWLSRFTWTGKLAIVKTFKKK